MRQMLDPVTLTLVSAPLLNALLVAVTKSAVLLLVALGLTSLMRHAAAAARHLVLALALASALLLPALELIVPGWEVPLLPTTALGAPGMIAPSASAAVPTLAATGEPGTLVASTLDAATRTPPTAGVQLVSTPPVIDLIDTLPVRLGASRPAITTTTVKQAPVGSGAALLREDGARWPAWVILLWATGTVLILLRLLTSALGLSRLRRRAAPVADASWLALAQRHAHKLGIVRPVTLLQGDSATVPVTWGIIYPAILLPAGAETWSSERRSTVLLHELAHVRRVDAFTQLVAQVACAVYWFNPLVWMTAWRMRVERERACD